MKKHNFVFFILYIHCKNIQIQHLRSLEASYETHLNIPNLTELMFSIQLFLKMVEYNF
jgi:hypothetical protein